MKHLLIIVIFTSMIGATVQAANGEKYLSCVINNTDTDIFFSYSNSSNGSIQSNLITLKPKYSQTMRSDSVQHMIAFDENQKNSKPVSVVQDVLFTTFTMGNGCLDGTVYQFNREGNKVVLNGYSKGNLKPDFVISLLDSVRNLPLGVPVTIRVKIQNVGPVATERQIEVSGTGVAEKQIVDGLNSGESKIVKLPIDIKTQRMRIENAVFRVDYKGKIKESNEDNNKTPEYVMGWGGY